MDVAKESRGLTPGVGVRTGCIAPFSRTGVTRIPGPARYGEAVGLQHLGWRVFALMVR